MDSYLAQQYNTYDNPLDLPYDLVFDPFVEDDTVSKLYFVERPPDPTVIDIPIRVRKIRRIRRASKACDECKKTHRRCDDMRPCRHCTNCGIAYLCTGSLDNVSASPKSKPKPVHSVDDYTPMAGISTRNGCTMFLNHVDTVEEEEELGPLPAKRPKLVEI